MEFYFGEGTRLPLPSAADGLGKRYGRRRGCVCGGGSRSRGGRNSARIARNIILCALILARKHAEGIHRARHFAVHGVHDGHREPRLKRRREKGAVEARAVGKAEGDVGNAERRLNAQIPYKRKRLQRLFDEGLFGGRR